jgi:hypothetical protein
MGLIALSYAAFFVYGMIYVSQCSSCIDEGSDVTREFAFGLVLFMFTVIAVGLTLLVWAGALVSLLGRSLARWVQRWDERPQSGQPN